MKRINLRKLALSLICLVLASSLLSSCTSRSSRNHQSEIDSQSEKRIKILEKTGMYEIISVDGVEYISRGNGGMVKHVK